MEHARRHFDYLPGTSGTGSQLGGGDDGSYSNAGSVATGRVALDVGAGASFGLPMNPRQAYERGREIFPGASAESSSLQMNQSGAAEATAQEHADAAAAAQRARLQSALLTLGVAHFRFHHSGEALKALNEAVRTAQQNGDEASLAHALAAFCALCASSSGSLASTEGAPAVEEWRTSGAGGDEGDKTERGSRGSISVQPPAVQAAADARLLLRRLAKQARTLRIPHLMAYGELARARHVASRPPCGPAPWSRGLEAEGGRRRSPGRRVPVRATRMYQPPIRRCCSGESPPRPRRRHRRDAARGGVAARGDAGRRGAARRRSSRRRRRPRADREPTGSAPIRTSFIRRRRVSRPPSRAGASRRWSSSRGAAACCARPCGTRTGFRRWRGCTRFDTFDATRRIRLFVKRDDSDATTKFNPKTFFVLESFRIIPADRRTKRRRTRRPPPRATPPPRWRSSRGTRRRITVPDAGDDGAARRVASVPKAFPNGRRRRRRRSSA